MLASSKLIRMTPTTLSAAGLGLLIVVAIVSLSQPSAALEPGRAPETGVEAAAQEPSAVTTEDCLACHADQGPSPASHHSVLETRGGASSTESESSCTACHGDPTAHLESLDPADIFTYRSEDSPVEASERCLTCHASDHPTFQSSPHGRAGVSCTSCHTVHEGPEAVLAEDRSDRIGLSTMVGRASESCANCHAGVATEFAFTEHHRLEEGTLSCSSCHDPHAPSQRMLLGGLKQQECIGCHQDKGGPYVFEHGSSTVEGCNACHTPHGSPNRHMLKFQSVADQCYSCHVLVPGFHTRFEPSTVCTNCHTTIHGSNLHPFFLK